ncbi:FAD/NAD(P)-binding protein [Pseudotabrizicola formosa]|uniref:FAD/NAD(P)-binding protein n=1 Tax=Pseudotabrizicola formosa TaxID=2030009 RepID=UPI000CD12200|nr:FAD/NAD(P)-binding protein [Pseudotabrizicola formosa]
MKSVAIIGTGPTGLYTFAGLSAGPACRITLYEKGDTIGVGTPYSLDSATKAMLANIASIEIPPLVTGYLDWMQAQSDADLARFGLVRADLDERLFTPRLMLGSYFHDQFQQLIARAQAAGHQVVVKTGVEVTDIVAQSTGLRLVVAAAPSETAVFDHVIVASGHSFAEDDPGTGRYFPNPWSGLIQTDIPALRVGILGTSLSAIDAAMAVATQHGRFRLSGRGEDLTYDLDDAAADGTGLQITLMSRSGVLPEADFYCPIPYSPLQVMTDSALTQALAGPRPLDAVFDLFRAEIAVADPEYAEKIGLDQLTADDVAQTYFADRMARDPFGWARENLREVEANKANKVTVGWRYAILRMHEQVEAVVASLPEADRARFDAGLKRVFIDNYAAVPPESIRRLLALRDAGVLRVVALGEDYDLEPGPQGTVITLAPDADQAAPARQMRFDVFIDARGQRPMAAEDMPFPGLRRAVLEAGQEVPDLDAAFALTGVPGFEGRLVLAALPYLMHDRPFVQGITASAEIGAVIAEALAEEMRAETPRAARRKRRIDQWGWAA